MIEDYAHYRRGEATAITPWGELLRNDLEYKTQRAHPAPLRTLLTIMQLHWANKYGG